MYLTGGSREKFICMCTEINPAEKSDFNKKEKRK